MSVPGLGNVFQNVLGNGSVGNILNGAIGGGGGVGGLAETGVEMLHTHSPLGKVGADIAANTSGGVLNAEGLGDAAGIVADFYTGNWFGVVDGAKDLLENFANFDINKVGHQGLLKMLDPSGNLSKMLPQTPGMKLVEGLKDSFLGKHLEGRVQQLGKLAKALPGFSDILGGGKGKGGGAGKIAKDIPVLGDMFNLLGKSNNMGGGIQKALTSLIKS